MNLFRNLFGSGNDSSKEENDSDFNLFSSQKNILPIDELFTLNFKKNGGKFLYCESLTELKNHFEDILEENDWFESDVLCFESKLFNLLQDNKLNYINPKNSKFLFATCENLIADEGSILLSSNQIKQNKSNELPRNIIVLATTSQIVGNKSDGMREIKRRYDHNKIYPTNITTFAYFKQAKEDDFLHYGSVAKNLYLLLLEDL
jgi:hypothetical protein